MSPRLLLLSLPVFRGFLLASPLVGQSSYFARDYPNHSDQLATEVFFHPQRGYSVVWGGLSGSRTTTLHRMDGAGNIGLSYISGNPNHLHFNPDLDTAGNHWWVNQPVQVINAGNASNFDSVMVTYLHATSFNSLEKEKSFTQKKS